MSGYGPFEPPGRPQRPAPLGRCDRMADVGEPPPGSLTQIGVPARGIDQIMG